MVVTEKQSRGWHPLVLKKKKKKKKNLFLFDRYVKTIHTYTLSMSYIYNLNNTNMKIIANMVIMGIINRLLQYVINKFRIIVILQLAVRR